MVRVFYQSCCKIEKLHLFIGKFKMVKILDSQLILQHPFEIVSADRAFVSGRNRIAKEDLCPVSDLFFQRFVHRIGAFLQRGEGYYAMKKRFLHICDAVALLDMVVDGCLLLRGGMCSVNS